MWGLLRNRRVLFVAALVVALLAVALWPQAIEVDAATVARGPLVVTIDEEGETRLHHRFAVSAPVSGRVLRIELEPGDLVERNKTVVARLQADAPPLLDERDAGPGRGQCRRARAMPSAAPRPRSSGPGRRWSWRAPS